MNLADKLAALVAERDRLKQRLEDLRAAWERDHDLLKISIPSQVKKLKAGISRMCKDHAACEKHWRERALNAEARARDLEAGIAKIRVLLSEANR